MKLAISEIFYSIQGEGFHSGTPAVFIRTAGCNLNCPFCDTDFSEREKIATEVLISQIEEYPAKFIVLTGGEPTLQPEACISLINSLRKKGYFVALETNGTSRNSLGADWVTVSPKLEMVPDQDWVLRDGDELKVVYHGQDLEQYEQSRFTYYYLQPLALESAWTKDVTKARAVWRNSLAAVLNSPKWRLSIQLHKILGIP